jgi:hypothetical protein
MQRMLVSGGGDDGVNLAVQRQLDCLFNGMPSDAAGANGPGPVAALLSSAEAPTADSNPMIRGESIDLIASANQSDLGLNR